MKDFCRVFFAPDGEQAGGSPAPVTTPPAADPTPEVAKYTDKQLNDLIAKNSGKASEKTRSEILAELGVDSFDTLKARLTKQAEADKANMTEAEKYKAELEAEKKARADAEGKMTAAELKAEIIGKGVPADKAEKVVKLAAGYDGATIADKVAAVLTDFPEFIKTAQPQSIGIETKKHSVNDEEALLAQLGAAVGLKSKV